MTVVAEDSEGANDSIEVTIEVTDANDPPSFDPDDNTRRVAENTELGRAIGDPVTATDPDAGGTLTYRLEGTDAAAFDIDSTSGQLRTWAALDHEAQPSYSVTVVAEDSEGASDSIEVTIAVTNANEPPSFDTTLRHAHRGREHRTGAGHRRPGSGHGPRGQHADLQPGGNGCGCVRHRRGQWAAPHQRRARLRDEVELLGDGGGGRQ